MMKETPLDLLLHSAITRGRFSFCGFLHPPVQHRQIRRSEIHLLQFCSWQPAQGTVLMRKRLGTARLHATAKRMQRDLAPLIRMKHGRPSLDDLHRAAKLLDQLAVQGLRRRFIQLDLPSRKLPAATQALSRRPLRDEHKPVTLNDGTDNVGGGGGHENDRVVLIDQPQIAQTSTQH